MPAEVPAILENSKISYFYVLRIADVTGIKVGGKIACTSIHCQVKILKFRGNPKLMWKNKIPIKNLAV